MERVLLTGANGFLGRAILSELLRLPVQVRATVRTTEQVAVLRTELQRHHSAEQLKRLELRPQELSQRFALPALLEQCSSAIHAAGRVTLRGESPSLLYRDQVEGTAQLLEAALKGGLSKVVVLVPALSLGASTLPEPWRPSHPWALNEVPSTYVQASRIRLLEALRASSRGLPVVFAHPTFCVGPMQASAQLPAWAELLLQPPPLPLLGGLNVVDVRDAARGVVDCWQHGELGQPQLLVGHNRSFEQLGRALRLALTQRAGRFLQQELAERPGGARLARLSTKGWQELMGLRSRLPFLPPPDMESIALLGRWWWYEANKPSWAPEQAPRPLEQSLQAWAEAQPGR